MTDFFFPLFMYTGGAKSNYLHHSHEHGIEMKNNHTKHGDGEDGHGSKAGHSLEKAHGGKHLSMHERAQAAMKDKKAHGDGPHHVKHGSSFKKAHGGNDNAHHGKRSAHDHGDEIKKHKSHHGKHKDHSVERHSSHGRH